jgi:fructokinase
MVYTLGEILLDIIFKNNDEVVATPGGAMLNVSVSLSSLGIPVTLISEIGKDSVGALILDFLYRNNVNKENIFLYDDKNTSLALAFLDKNGKPEYSFYKTYPETGRLKKDINFKKHDIILFASYYSVDPRISNEVKTIIEDAKKKGVTVIYDPNIRQSKHLRDIGILKAVYKNIEIADLIKGSDEDFANIFGYGEPEYWLDKIREINPRAPVIITLGSRGVVGYINSKRFFIYARKVKVVSTVGAGDAFSAGLISGILEKGKNIDTFNDDDWNSVLVMGISVSAEVCTLNQNYIPKK